MFSVLMSVYFRENPKYFMLSLDSIIHQTLPPAEIILIKDGPLSKELDDVITSYEQEYPNLFKIISLSENKGLGTALAIGVEKCSYELIARMDTDDIARKDRFEKQITFMQTHPEIDVVGSNVAEFENDPEKIVSYRILPEFPEEIRKFGKKRCPVNHPTIIYRKSSVLHTGNYKPVKHNTGFEDYYLWMRMLNQGMNFYNMQECLVYSRIGNDMIGRRHGHTYFKSELNCFRLARKMKYINYFEFITAIITRGIVRLVPKNITHWIYLNMLRH